MASIFSKRIAALCAATLVGATANAAAEYTTEDDGATLVVTVDAAGATLDASQIGAGTTKIVKRGPGKLTATPIASYAGDFDIEEGIWCCTAAGDFGATSTTASSGTIWVRDGASIEYAGSNKYPGTLSGKTVHLYGSAASGATSGSKIFLSANTQMADPGLGKNAKVYLHDDATFYSKNRMAICTTTFDLGGKKLTLQSNSFNLGGVVTNGGAVVVASSTTLMAENQTLTFAADCADTAYVEVKSSGTLNVKYGKTAANGWTLKNNGGTVTCNAQHTPTATATGNWDGPIELSGSAKVANWGSSVGNWSVGTTVFNINGPVSGTGTLAVGPGWLNMHSAEEDTYSGAVTVQGKSTKQEATGTEIVIPPSSGGIGLWNGASAFVNASSITLKDSARVEFMDETASTVGALTFVGDTSTFTGDPGDDTQSIQGGSSVARSTIAGITKKGDNVLVVDSPVHVTGATIVSNGTLKIPFRSARGTPGLVESHATPKTVDTWTDIQYIYEPMPAYWRIFTPWNSNNASHCDVTEKGICAVGAQRAYNGMINSNTSGWDDGYVATLPSGYKSGRNAWWYSGYVWNNTDAPATYTVWFGGNGATGSAIWFGEDHSACIQLKVGSNNTQHGKSVADAQEFTLQPGATKIDIVVVSEQNFWGQSVPSDGERYGLVYAPTSVCTAEHLNELIVDYYDSASTASTNALSAALRQFGEFKDEGGIGELFTVDVYGDADADKKVAYQPVFDDLEFAYGTTLDLSDNISFQVKNLTGSPAVVNAVEFRITNNWTICSADFPKADSTVRHPMTVDGKLVFAEGATFSVDDESAIKRVASGIVVATATDGIVGRPKAAPSLTRKWKLRIDGNVAKLIDSSGLIVVIR